MKPRRRWFQYSLRSFLVPLTAFAVWLGVVVDRAREQREAVKAINELGGLALVTYDWESTGSRRPAGPHWLRRTIGDEFFQNVDTVTLQKFGPESDILNSIPPLQRMRPKKVVLFVASMSEKLEHTLRSSLPHAEVTIIVICRWSPLDVLAE
jgi:hypothetical protein